MDITRDTVDHYARLAGLTFAPDEADAMARDLGTILRYVDKIGELDLTGVPATSQVLGRLQDGRADVSRPGLGTETALAGAPDKESGHFLVPKMIKR